MCRTGLQGNGSLKIQVAHAPLPKFDSFAHSAFPHLLHPRQARASSPSTILTVLGGLTVHANVEARDAEVCNRARKRGLDLEGAAVRVDGLLGVAPVGERRTETVPEEVVLAVSAL